MFELVIYESLTIAAAAVFTFLYFRVRKSPAVFTTMLMFWGAALMWSVDFVAKLIDEEETFEVTASDATRGFLLGGIVLAAGLIVFGALSFFDRRRTPAVA